MKFHFSCLIVFLALQSGAQTKEIAIRPKPAWVKNYSYTTEVKDTANTSNGYFTLLNESQYNSILHQSYYHFAIKIISEAGLESNSTISVDFDPSYEEVTFHKVEVIRNGKKINHLFKNSFDVLRREKNMDMQIYDKNLTALFNFQDLQVGDIVEYDYTHTGDNPLYKNKYSKFYSFNYGSPVGLIQCRLIAKRGTPLEFRKINAPPDPVITNTGNQIEYEWKRQDASPLLSEESTPGWHDPYDQVNVGAFGTWSDIATDISSLYKIEGHQNLLQKIPGIDKNNIEGSISRLIQFVQDEVRYLSFSDGIHGHKPHQPEKILSQKFGDCKDKSFLLTTLLQELGIKSFPVLVNTSYGKALPDYVPSPYLFDHCIVQFFVQDSIYWVDPTINFQRGPLKELYCPNYYFGLVIDKNSKSLTEIPTPRQASIHIHEDFVLDKVGGKATLNVKSTFTKQEANSIRRYFKNNSQSEVEKQYLNFYATDYPDIVKGLSIKWSDDEQKNIFVSAENYEILKFWNYDSTLSKYSAEVYPRYLATYLVKPTTKIRQAPYSLTYPLNVTHSISIHMPEAWSVTTTTKKIETDGFLYHSSTDYHDQIIDLVFHFETMSSAVEPGKIKDHIAKLDDALDDLTFSISFNTSLESKKSFNYPFLIILIITLALSYFGFKKLYDFDPESEIVSVRFSSIGGWLILPALGICFTPISMIYNLKDVEFFSYSNWQILSDSDYAAYNPAQGLFILIEFLIDALLLTYSVFLAFLFFKRRTSVPDLATAFYIFNFVFVTGDSLVATQFGVEFDRESYNSSFKALLGVLIWVPYFRISDRSKGTFRVRREA